MLDKLKSSVSISERDKKLLMIVVAFALIIAAYFLGYQKLMDQTSEYEAEATALKAKHRDLMDKSNKQGMYQTDTAKYKDVTNAILAEYTTGLTQDASLMFIHGMENATSAWIKSVTMTSPETIYSFGNVRSTNPSSAGNAVYSTDMKGIKSTYTMAYEASYSDWKELMTYINGYYSKNTIDSISMTYNSANDIVSGTMVMSAYAITGSNRVHTAPKIELPISTVNIFNSSSFEAGEFNTANDNGEYILSNYDYFMMLNSSTADADAVIIGKKDDTTRESILSANNNAPENVSIRFSGSNGNYSVAYKIGNATYPATDYEKGVNFDAGPSLDLLIMSSARLSSADKSGVNLTVINETDMTVNVKICNDDANSPRVSIVKSGNVEIYK